MLHILLLLYVSIAIATIIRVEGELTLPAGP